MAIDASIYGMIKPQQAGPGPLEQYAQVAQVRGLMDANDINSLKKSEMERSIASQGKLRDLFSRGNVKPEEVMAIDPATGMAFAKNQRDAQKSDAELKVKNMEMLAKATGILKDRLPTVRDEASFQAYKEGALQLLGPDMVGKLNLPQTFDQNWVRNQLVEAKDLFTPKPTQVKMPDGSIKTVDMNPFTNPQAVNFSAAPGMTPAEQATRDNQRASLTETQRHNQVTEGQPFFSEVHGAWMPRPTPGAPAAPVAAPAATQVAGPAVAPSQAPAAAAAPVAAPGTPIPVPGVLPKAEIERQAKEKERKVEVTRTLNTYAQARDGLLNALGESETGPITGRIPAFTSGQQTAEGAVAAMAPVLKQLFRTAGEGTFTDKDQELLLNMVPTRADRPEARKAKMENIDRIVAAKLGMEVPVYKAPTPKEVSPSGVSGGVDPSKLSDDELRRELGL